jgi:hypothetical protein
MQPSCTPWPRAAYVRTELCLRTPTLHRGRRLRDRRAGASTDEWKEEGDPRNSALVPMNALSGNGLTLRVAWICHVPISRRNAAANMADPVGFTARCKSNDKPRSTQLQTLPDISAKTSLHQRLTDYRAAQQRSRFVRRVARLPQNEPVALA